MTSLTIRHTRAEGTMLEGSSKGDGAWPVLRDLRCGWRYWKTIGAIGLQHSRDRSAKTWQIERSADALRQAGFTVAIVVDETTARTFAEAEAERYERAEERAETFDGRADRAAASSAGHRQTSDAMYSRIPFGQPILIGHHSEGADRRFRARAEGHFRRSISEGKRAAHWDDRAQAAAAYERHRKNIPRTLRRIEKLEADERRQARAIAAEITAGRGDDPWRTEQHRRLAETREQLTYWRAHVAEAEAEGYKVWGRADFHRGDFAHARDTWYQVVRVNPKSLTVPWIINVGDIITTENAGYRGTSTLPYDKVNGRMSASEMADHIAARQTSRPADAPADPTERTTT